MDDPTIQKMMAEGAPGFGSGEGDPDGEGEGSVPGQIDQHGGWDNMSDEERQIAQHKVKEALRQAVRKCDRNGQWGTIPASTREELRRLASDAVDWKKVLQNFAGTRQRMNKAHTMRRINRKYPYIHPGVQRSHTAHIGVFVDMSGSVSDVDLEQVYAVLGSLAKKVTFTFLPFDYTVDEANKFEWKKGKKQDPIRFRSGGTSFIAVNEYVKKHRDLFDGIIICTDGEAEDPGPSPVRRCWVLVPGTKLIFPATPGDVVVSMDKAKANLQAA
jgi:predicted metal-dependent peptidase